MKGAWDLLYIFAKRLISQFCHNSEFEAAAMAITCAYFASILGVARFRNPNIKWRRQGRFKNLKIFRIDEIMKDFFWKGTTREYNPRHKFRNIWIVNMDKSHIGIYEMAPSGQTASDLTTQEPFDFGLGWVTGFRNAKLSHW